MATTFQASTYQSLYPVQLAAVAVTAADVTIYTTPKFTRTLVKDINITNTTSTAITVNLHIVPGADSATTSNALFYGYSVAANTTYRWTGVQVMNSEEKLVVKGSTTGLTIFASGAEAV